MKKNHFLPKEAKIEEVYNSAKKRHEVWFVWGRRVLAIHPRTKAAPCGKLYHISRLN